MSKKILVVLSEWGYWGEELVGPYDVLAARGLSDGLRDSQRQETTRVAPQYGAGYSICRLIRS